MSIAVPCVFCGRDAGGRRGWCTPISIGRPTFIEVMEGAEQIAIVLRTCVVCIAAARSCQRERSVIGMYTPRRPPGVVMGAILDDALTAARDEDERWMRESDNGTKFPMRAVDPSEVVGLSDFVPVGEE